VKIKAMKEEDVAQALRLRNWNIDEEMFRRYALFFPEESFVAEKEGKIIAHAATVHYGQCAWMGRIFLKESERKKGIGRAFVSQIIEKLISEGTKTIYLESLEQKAPFFERLGFAAISKNLSFKGRGGSSAATAREYLSDELFKQLCRFDREHFKADRGKVLRLFLSDSAGLVFLEKTGEGAIAGYIMARRSPRGYAIGPWVAAREAAEGLLNRMAGALPEGVDVRLKVPQSNHHAVELLQKSSFVDEGASTIRMRYGENIDIAEGPLIYALGSHASG